MSSFFSTLTSSPAVVDGVSTLRFDPQINQIRELFNDCFGLGLTASEQELLDFLAECDLASAIKLGHDVLNSEAFDLIFDKALGDLEKIYGQIAYQARPTFRIQKTGVRSVPFHTDDLSSGHPDQIINIWLPLVSLNKQNTLHFVPRADSDLIKKDFQINRQSIDWITEQSLNIARPWISTYGNVVLFSNATLHGTMYNDSSPRASIDFRILPDYYNCKMNKKKLYADYFPYIPGKFNNWLEQSSSAFVEATSVISANGDASHLSHSLQRSIVNEFADKNAFSIIRETAEWQTPHYPIIEEILDRYPSMHILLATEKSFMNNGVFTPEFLNIKQRLIDHSGVYFCLENKKVA